MADILIQTGTKGAVSRTKKRRLEAGVIYIYQLTFLQTPRHRFRSSTFSLYQVSRQFHVVRPAQAPGMLAGQFGPRSTWSACSSIVRIVLPLYCQPQSGPVLNRVCAVVDQGFSRRRTHHLPQDEEPWVMVILT